MLDLYGKLSYHNIVGFRTYVYQKGDLRMKIRMFTLLLVAAIACASFAGCALFGANSGETNPEPTQRTIAFAEPTYTTFSVEEMELKLPDRFQRQDTDSLIQFIDDNYAVLLMREAFDAYPVLRYMTIEEYGRVVLEASGIDADIEIIDGLYCFEYEALALGRTTKYNYFVVIYKSNQAFWIVQFGSVFWNASAMRSEFTKWAKMIEFTD